MADFSKLEQGVWPFRIGGKMVHESWRSYSDHMLETDALLVLNHVTNPVTFETQVQCKSSTSSHLYTYGQSSFDPVSQWFYLNGHVERKKKGFGKWFSDVSSRSEPQSGDSEIEKT